MNDDLVFRIQAYVRDHCLDEFPSDRARQIEILQLAGYSRLRTSAGKGPSRWKKSSLPLAACKDERIRAVARRQYDLAQQLFNRMAEEITEWPQPEAVPNAYKSSGCGCINYEY